MLVEEIVNVQKKFFRTGTTRKIEYRLNSLQILKDGIHRMMPEIYAAIGGNVRRKVIWPRWA